MLPVDGGHLSEMSKLNGAQGLLTKQVSRLVLTPVPPAYLYLCRLGKRLPGANKRASLATSRGEAEGQQNHCQEPGQAEVM